MGDRVNIKSNLKKFLQKKKKKKKQLIKEKSKLTDNLKPIQQP